MPSIVNATTTAGVAVSGDNSGVLALQTNNGTTAVTIDTSQNVGIGTASPAVKTEISGTAAASNLALRITNTATDGYSTLQMGGGDAGIYRNGSAQSGYAGASSLNLITVGAHNIGFSTQNTLRAIIDSSGQVGIGTSSPVAGRGLTLNSSSNYFGLVLQTSGTTRGQIIQESTGNIYVDAGSDGGGGALIFRTTGGIERARIDSSGALIMASNAGYLGLATNQTMRVPSTGGIGYVGNINSSTVFQIAYNSTSAGVQLSSGATSWGTFSDSRLKNITGTYTNALNDIAQIQPVKFTWKSDEDNKPQVGVVAQSVENVVPEAVDSTTIEMDGTEKYLTVRYTELIPLMIASIQELNAKVEAQAAEIAALKGVK
jgi:hypothetical protein